MVAPQQPPPILPTTTESASANDALPLITAGTTPNPAVQTPTTPTSTYKEYEDGYNGFDDMTSSKPSPSSKNHLNINIRKRSK